MIAYGMTDKQNCEYNEDACKIKKINDFIFLAVADGQGGYPGLINIGELILTVAFDYIEKTIQANTSTVQLKNILDESLFVASQTLKAINVIDERYSGLHGSVVIMAISELSLSMCFSSIGNSELYLIRNGKLLRMNRLDTVAYQNMEKGDFPSNEYYLQADRGMLTQAIGIYPKIYPDTQQGYITQNDIWFLATDGIFRHMSPEELIEIFDRERNIETTVKLSLTECKKRGGLDNASIVCCYIPQ